MFVMQRNQEIIPLLAIFETGARILWLIEMPLKWDPLGSYKNEGSKSRVDESKSV